MEKINNKFIFALLILIFLFISLHCEDSDDQNEAENLIGTWITNCYSFEEAATPPTFSQTTFSVADEKNYSYNSYVYITNDCSGEITSSSSMSGTYEIGGEVPDVDPAAVAEVMEDATESLTQEVQRSVDFFSATSSDEKVQKVFITGGVSMVPSIKESLQNRLGVEVHVIDPWRQITFNEKDFDPEYLQAMGPIYTVAAGLAMRRMGDK